MSSITMEHQLTTTMEYNATDTGFNSTPSLLTISTTAKEQPSFNLTTMRQNATNIVTLGNQSMITPGPAATPDTHHCAFPCMSIKNELILTGPHLKHLLQLLCLVAIICGLPANLLLWKHIVQNKRSRSRRDAVILLLSLLFVVHIFVQPAHNFYLVTNGQYYVATCHISGFLSSFTDVMINALSAALFVMEILHLSNCRHQFEIFGVQRKNTYLFFPLGIGFTIVLFLFYPKLGQNRYFNFRTSLLSCSANYAYFMLDYRNSQDPSLREQNITYFVFLGVMGVAHFVCVVFMIAYHCCSFLTRSTDGFSRTVLNEEEPSSSVQAQNTQSDDQKSDYGSSRDRPSTNSIQVLQGQLNFFIVGLLSRYRRVLGHPFQRTS